VSASGRPLAGIAPISTNNFNYLNRPPYCPTTHQGDVRQRKLGPSSQPVAADASSHACVLAMLLGPEEQLFAPAGILARMSKEAATICQQQICKIAWTELHKDGGP